LPDKQPAYAASRIYVFGVLTLAALVLVLISGTLLALAGPQWYHTSSLGHFVNSLYLWSVNCSSSSWPSICGASSSWPPGEAGAL
jgi:ubiquinol-cytochrome c reductase cytochrome b subunit